MDAIEAARREAEVLHIQAISFGDNPEDLLTFVQSIAERQKLDVYPVAQGDTQLKGGKAVFDCQANIILYEEAGTPFERAFLIAHELGHVILEGGDQDFITNTIEPDCSIEDAPIGIEKVVDYGPRERREVRMDIFARELLLPRTQLRRLHIDENLSSSDIAQHFNAPVTVVKQQLLDGLLLPLEISSQSTDTPHLPLIPDETQIQATVHRNSPFLLQAGPGTGKTRTLVQRIESLLSEGVDPTSILVLTFSNKAANELSERLAKSNRVAAAAMWIGTFHAFGLDIIRRFHMQLGLSANPRLIDQMDAIELLENELSRLPLKHFRNLWDPTLDLSEMLSAISRAKDEVVNAENYRNLAQVMIDSSVQDSEERVRAEKCMEVATLYQTYESLMKEKQLIDFGDLVSKPVELIESDEAARSALKLRHRYVLVDEYQDVNRASIRLLKAIVDDGNNLWAVGDSRQSIYRFRGASSSNVRLFTNDFPNAVRRQLGVNYRSSQEIVNVFTAFSNQMNVSKSAPPPQLVANRGLLHANPIFQTVVSKDDEVSAIASSIQQNHEAGVEYRKHAVLCASNARLNEIARGLESQNIPVLHLGSLFTRPEIKNLLALLSMLTDPYVSGLITVAQMPEFEMSLQDVITIITYLKDNKTKPLEWTQISTTITGIESKSRNSLQRVSKLFEGLKISDTPWSILTTWILDKFDYGVTIARVNDTSNQMKSLALWQFLNFCRNQPTKAGIPTSIMLDRIRRLILLNEDRGLRQLPKAAENINAVRLLTIHASKGLEFEFVHIPSMVKTSLPRTNRPPRCTPPDGLIYGSVGMTGIEAIKAGHDEEEECLFFVALSRARNQLFLYAYTSMPNGNSRGLSDFITPIKSLLSISSSTLPRNEVPSLENPLNVFSDQKPIWTVQQIRSFEKCPRRFLYTHILNLGGHRKETAFMKMHDVVYDILDWLKGNHETTTPSEAEIEKRYSETWDKKGAMDHGYAEDYRRIGKQLVEFLMNSRKDKKLLPIAPVFLDFPQSNILVKPDTLSEKNNGQKIVGYIKTGKPKSNEFDDIEYTILQQATLQNYGAAAKAEVVYLTSATEATISLTPRKFAARYEKLRTMLQRIHKGEFPAQEDTRVCPSCPHFFICGTLPTGAIRK